MSATSPPIVKIDTCALCGKSHAAVHHTPGQLLDVWSPREVERVDPVTRKAQTFHRMVCPDCAKTPDWTEDVKHKLEAEFTALSKS